MDRKNTSLKRLGADVKVGGTILRETHAARQVTGSCRDTWDALDRKLNSERSACLRGNHCRHAEAKLGSVLDFPGHFGSLASGMFIGLEASAKCLHGKPRKKSSRVGFQAWFLECLETR